MNNPIISIQRYSSNLPRPADDDDFWYDAESKATSATGFTVTELRAMQTAAVIACVKVLAESISSLPLHYYSIKGNKREKMIQDPLYTTLRRKPNDFMTSYEWRTRMMYHLCLRGNSYDKIVSGANGAYSSFIPLNPNQVTPKITNDTLTYEYRKDTGATEILRADQVLHIKGLSADGLIGLNPIEMYKEIFGATIATDTYASKFFNNDAKPGGVLKHPGILGEEAAKTLRRTWMGQHGGAINAHTIAILEEGMEFQPIGINNSDAQFLETRKYNLEDIARIYRIPLHMIGNLDRSTNNNIEQQALEFVTYTLSPWLINIEEAINAKLFGDDATKYVKFNVDALLRGDTFTRFRAHALALQNGFKSVNEVRELEDMDPIEGGDTYQVYKVGNNSNPGTSRGSYDRSNKPAPGSTPEDDESGE